jgi:short subunit dehydrogenase-like uncharacterized protein
MDTLLVYGANGYTGRLVLDAAKAAGITPIIAGRDPVSIEALAAERGLSSRVFSLDASDAVRAGLDGVHTVLHCAGPFSRTAKPMVEACIATGTHYLDITGEIAVFERLKHKFGSAAAEAGVMLLPGVGFDVVPSDCLAKHLSTRCPEAVSIDLAFAGSGGLSHGTATTMVENIAAGGAVREAGVIKAVPTAFHTRDFDFGRGARAAVTIPWGDVSTAFYSTGVPNIRVYLALPSMARCWMHLSRPFGGLLGTRVAQGFLQTLVDTWVKGPDANAREAGKVVLVGEAKDAAGTKYAARLTTPEAYSLTATVAVHIAKKVLQGEFVAGFQTPSSVFGADLILEIPGVERTEIN